MGVCVCVCVCVGGGVLPVSRALLCGRNVAEAPPPPPPPPIHPPTHPHHHHAHTLAHNPPTPTSPMTTPRIVYNKALEKVAADSASTARSRKVIHHWGA